MSPCVCVCLCVFTARHLSNTCARFAHVRCTRRMYSALIWLGRCMCVLTMWCEHGFFHLLTTSQTPNALHRSKFVIVGEGRGVFSQAQQRGCSGHKFSLCVLHVCLLVCRVGGNLRIGHGHLLVCRHTCCSLDRSRVHVCVGGWEVIRRACAVKSLRSRSYLVVVTVHVGTLWRVISCISRYMYRCLSERVPHTQLGLSVRVSAPLFRRRFNFTFFCVCMCVPLWPRMRAGGAMSRPSPCPPRVCVCI